jgi:O-antigen ligase
MKIDTNLIIKSNALNLFLLSIFFLVGSFFTEIIAPQYENSDFWFLVLSGACFISSISNYFIKLKK